MSNSDEGGEAAHSMQRAGADTKKQRPVYEPDGGEVQPGAQWRWQNAVSAWRVQTDHGAHVGRCIIGVPVSGTVAL